MYTLKTPSPSNFSELSKVINNFLVENKVDMVDRRNVTAYMIAKVVGGSLPVSELANQRVSAAAWRDMHLAAIKAYLGRLREAVTLDTDLILMGAYHEWIRRCLVAFPSEPCLENSGVGGLGSVNGWATGEGTFTAVINKYPNLAMSWVLINHLVQREVA